MPARQLASADVFASVDLEPNSRPAVLTVRVTMRGSKILSEQALGLRRNEELSPRLARPTGAVFGALQSASAGCNLAIPGAGSMRGGRQLGRAQALALTGQAISVRLRLSSPTSARPCAVNAIPSGLPRAPL